MSPARLDWANAASHLRGAQALVTSDSNGRVDSTNAAVVCQPGVRRFLYNPSFSDQKIERIVTWIDAGSPRGEPGTEPAPLEFSDSWSIGEPDLILSMPTPVSIDANNVDRFVRVKIKTELTEDRWIKAVEVRPGDRALVHHAIVYVLQRGGRSNLEPNASPAWVSFVRILGR